MRRDQEASIKSGLELIELTKEFVATTDQRPFDSFTWVDHGCGVKLAQALLQYGVPFRHYIGLDVYGDMIDWLKANVSDARFEFITLDFQNEMYNPCGRKMQPSEDMPLPNDIDVFTMFSVVTHLRPSDVKATFATFRSHAAEGAHMVFSCFLNDEQPENFVDAVPGRPLLKATYRTAALRRIAANNGWHTVAVHAPIHKTNQHFFYCRAN